MYETSTAPGINDLTPVPDPGCAEVFVSYSSRDRERVLAIADELQQTGVRVWLDRNKIPGGGSYGTEIVRGIKGCKVLMLMCSDAALRSRNVKQEIQLAWKYGRPYLPLLLEPTGFPEQVEYWLEGFQWVAVHAQPSEYWLPQVLQALGLAGVHYSGAAPALGAAPIEPAQPARGLEGLRAVARLTDQIWPVPFSNSTRARTRSASRGLGAPQDDVQHGHRLGSRVSLAIESERGGHLLLLDEGPEGTRYCLCPSWFASDTHVQPGRSYLPQAGSRYNSFVVSGKPGREHLLAIITDEPIGLDWMPADFRTPARVLTTADVETLLDRLRSREADRWTALATYFEVLPDV
jgi:TIR domain/Domain of unknown function (DUF4384)